jgi:alpha-L-arabinofuranosidase
MTSYAPMLCKEGHHNWDPDMIYFTNTEVRTTPAYDVQRLFSVYGGDTYIASTFSVPSGSTGGKNPSYRLGASVVRNSKTGKTYVKLVNALPVSLELTVSGIAIPATARTEGFEGKPEDRRLDIKTGKAGTAIVLPPYSFRAIEL